MDGKSQVTQQNLFKEWKATVDDFENKHLSLKNNTFLLALKQDTIELIACHLFGRLAVIHLYDIPCTQSYISTYFIDFIEICLNLEIYPTILRVFSRLLSAVSLNEVCKEENDFSKRLFYEQVISIFMHVYQDCHNYIKDSICKRKKNPDTIVDKSRTPNDSRYILLKALQKNLPMTPLVNCLAISAADTSNGYMMEEYIKKELVFLCRLILFSNCHHYKGVRCFKEGCNDKIVEIIKEYPVPFLKEIYTYYFPIVNVDVNKIVVMIKD